MPRSANGTNRKEPGDLILAGELRRACDSRGWKWGSAQEVLIARQQPVGAGEQCCGEKRRVFGITREVWDRGRRSDIDRPHRQQLVPLIKSVGTQLEFRPG